MATAGRIARIKKACRSYYKGDGRMSVNDILYLNFTAHKCTHYKDGDLLVDVIESVIVDKETGTVYHAECDGVLGEVEDFISENAEVQNEN